MSSRLFWSPRETPLRSRAEAGGRARAGARGTAFVGRSLIELLQFRAAAQAGETAYTFLRDGEIEDAWLTWDELDRRSRAIAATLREHAAPGSRALLVYPPGLEFIAAFFGCVYAGVIAVPALPPHGMRSGRSLSRLIAICDSADPAAVLTVRGMVERWPEPGDTTTLQAPGLTGGCLAAEGPRTWMFTDQIDLHAADRWRQPDVNRETLAFLQYTSGSTAEPKGVMVSHGNLLHNLAYAFHLAANDGSSASVSWLPVTHDMGLIEGVLQPAYSGCPAWLMSPAAFLQRPARWLEAITRHRATRSGGPNFAYDLCARKVRPEERTGLDLRAWRSAYNGAEPVQSATLETFAAAFRECGFQSDALRPCYGLAEATLVVTSGRWNGRSALRVPCGSPLFGTRTEVVDPGTHQRVEPGQIGEIWVAGPSVAKGYWNRPEETAQTFAARLRGDPTPFVRTGDLGAIEHGQLVVAGRLKDLLIVRGVKHFPQDLELTALAQHAALRAGSVAAFAVASDPAGDRIAIAAEIDPRRIEVGSAASRVVAGIRRAVAEEHGIQLAAIALVAPGGVPKTTSGKLRRAACREMLLGGILDVLASWSADPILANT